MEPTEIKFITDRKSDLVKVTRCNVIFIAKLQQLGLLTDDEIDKLNNIHQTQSAKSVYLYDTLMTKDGAFKLLKETLNEFLQTGALKILDAYIPCNTNQPEREFTGVAGQAQVASPLRELTGGRIHKISQILSDSDVWISWTQVAGELGLSKTKVDDWKRQHDTGHMSPYDVYSASLYSWLTSSPRCANIEKFVHSLKICTLNSVAENVDKLK